jgi:hypothetical protein
MDEGGAHGFAWAGGAPHAVEWVSLVVIVVLIALGVHAVRRRKREGRGEGPSTERQFEDIIREKDLGRDETEFLRELAKKGSSEAMASLLTSVATFDGVAEKAVQETIEKGDRGRMQRLTRLLYSARAQLFPETLNADVPDSENREVKPNPEQEA